MKKVLVVLALSLFAVAAFAQKGKIYVGTSVMGFSGFGEKEGEVNSARFATGFTHINVKDVSKTNVFGLAPEVGYFVSDKWAIGLGVAYNHSSTKLEGDDESSKFNMFGVNPYARYYACSVDKFSFYMQGGFYFASGKADFEGAESTTNMGLNIRPGIAYNLSDKFAINATFGQLGWDSMKQDNAKITSFGLDLNMSTLLFGVTYSF